MKTTKPQSSRTHSAARTGKIARLPHEIREQLNRRLIDGEKGVPILNWLNGLPEVQAVLKAQFESRPISADNLSHWRKGGYRDWHAIQGSLSAVRDLEGQQARSRHDLAGPLASSLSEWLAFQYASCAQTLVADETCPERKWERLRELSADLNSLRRLAAFGKRTALDRQKLALKQFKASYLDE